MILTMSHWRRNCPMQPKEILKRHAENVESFMAIRLTQENVNSGYRVLAISGSTKVVLKTVAFTMITFLFVETVQVNHTECMPL